MEVGVFNHGASIKHHVYSVVKHHV
jgi:hypothetical protein